MDLHPLHRRTNNPTVMEVGERYNLAMNVVDMDTFKLTGQNLKSLNNQRKVNIATHNDEDIEGSKHEDIDEILSQGKNDLDKT